MVLLYPADRIFDYGKFLRFIRIMFYVFVISARNTPASFEI